MNFREYLPYFKSSFWVTGIFSLIGAGIGYYYNPTLEGFFSAFFIVIILSVLEVSLSFDNAVVNATVLKDMDPVWKHRFITWGMAIAVFGMRLVFPLLIVAIVAHLGPWDAIVLAATQPNEYARIMTSVHHEVAAFGGSFLLLVGLKYFFDTQKENHWIKWIEEPLVKVGRLEAVEVGIALAILVGFSKLMDPSESYPFLISGVFGVITFLLVEAIGTFLQVPSSTTQDLYKLGLSNFIYLEVLDASFSFDGVVGAFAITNNLFIIAIGLGIGAMFVRSLTIMMVEKGTLDAFKYLEHGAFYAIAAIAALMFLGTIIHVPEVFTGLIGAGFIIAAVIASVRETREEMSKKH